MIRRRAASVASLLAVVVAACERTPSQDERDPFNASTTPPTRAVGPATVTPGGGAWVWDNGLALAVPPGAVAADATIELTEVDAVVADRILQSSGLTERRLLAAFDVDAPGTTLALPATITMAAAGDPTPTGLALHFERDLATDTYVPAATDLVFDPQTRQVQLALRDLAGGHAVVEVGGLTPPRACGEAPCRCGPVRVTETSAEVVVDQGECQISRLVGSATYLACESGTVDTWRFAEIGAGCVPKLTLLAPYQMPVGARGDVRLKLGLADLPLANQGVSLLYRGGSLGLEAEDATTGPDGVAEIEIHASQKPGEVHLSALATATYRTAVAAANGETFAGPERTKETLAAPRTIIVVAWPAAGAPVREPTPEPAELALATKAKLDVTAIIDGVKSNTAHVLPCLQSARSKGEIVAGSYKLILDWVIQPNGTVTDAQLTGPANLMTTSLPTCFARTMKKWKFPASAQGAPVKNFPFGPFVVK